MAVLARGMLPSAGGMWHGHGARSPFLFPWEDLFVNSDTSLSLYFSLNPLLAENKISKEAQDLSI